MRHVHNLHLTSKFFLLGLVSLLVLALPVSLYFQGVLKDGRLARQVNQAHHTVISMNHVIKVVQSLRGISTAALSGDQVLAARRPQAQNLVVESINTLDAQLQEIGISADLQRSWQ